MSRIEQFNAKYAEYKKTTIDKYIDYMAKQAGDNFRWMISSDAKSLKIYNSKGNRNLIY
mgnify:CR=1 FL=1